MGGAARGKPSAERAPRVFLPLASIKPLDGSESQEEIEKKERKLLKAVMTSTLMAVKLQTLLSPRAHAARHPQKGAAASSFVYSKDDDDDDDGAPLMPELSRAPAAAPGAADAYPPGYTGEPGAARDHASCRR